MKKKNSSDETNMKDRDGNGEARKVKREKTSGRDRRHCCWGWGAGVDKRFSCVHNQTMATEGGKVRGTERSYPKPKVDRKEPGC